MNSMPGVPIDSLSRLAALFPSERITATSKAAEHWRRSWRERQYAEAGPAENVSRGQARVPSPLTAMQNSFIRMRAALRGNGQDGKRGGFGFWLTLALMLCLIFGLSGYIIYTYLPNASYNAASISHSSAPASPVLTIAGNVPSGFIAGQQIHLHGANFGANDQISFTLDTTTPVASSTGGPLVVQSDNSGAFDAAIPVTSSWQTGMHTLQAVDNRTHQSAFLNIQVNPAVTPETTSANLSLTQNGKPVQVLSFQGVLGRGNLPDQTITITNTSGAPLDWSVAASADHNLNWLFVIDNRTFGHLDISQPDTVRIGANITGLQVSPPNKPYTGNLLFTINGNEQLTVPVQLTITNPTPEMVFSPNPLVATAKPDGTCLNGATLTLINLGTQVITWSAVPDATGNLQFIDDQGKVLEHGTLNPSGINGDTVVLTLRCSQVQAGQKYHVVVYANTTSWSMMVLIR